MTYEPRQAQPGAIFRWTRQAASLVARGFSFWVGLAALFCVWMFLGQRLPLLDGMLALSAFFASVLIAAHVDRAGRSSAGALLAMLRAHARQILLFASIIAVAGAVIWMLLLSRPDVPWWNAFYSERHVVLELDANLYAALRQIFVYSAYALGLLYFGLNIPGLTSFFQFPCATLLGLSFRDAYRLSANGQLLNLPSILSVGLLFVTLPILCVLVLPPLVPLLYCYLGALSYVAFREIFLGITENQAPETVRAPASAPARG